MLGFLFLCMINEDDSFLFFLFVFSFLIPCCKINFYLGIAFRSSPTIFSAIVSAPGGGGSVTLSGAMFVSFPVFTAVVGCCCSRVTAGGSAVLFVIIQLRLPEFRFRFINVLR